MMDLLSGNSIIVVYLVMLILAFIFIKIIKNKIEPPHKKAGRKAEKIAAKRIESVLREGDIHLNNVSLIYNGQEAEFDNIIINKYGVFIIEVKGFSGELTGTENDRTWEKTHVSQGRMVYTKKVNNPLGQVKREIHILAKYLDYCDTFVWIKGYVMIIGAASPIKTEQFLESEYDIDRAIHTPGRRYLKKATIEKIAKLLS